MGKSDERSAGEGPEGRIRRGLACLQEFGRSGEVIKSPLVVSLGGREWNRARKTCIWTSGNAFSHIDVLAWGITSLGMGWGHSCSRHTQWASKLKGNVCWGVSLLELSQTGTIPAPLSLSHCGGIIQRVLLGALCISEALRCLVPEAGREKNPSCHVQLQATASFCPWVDFWIVLVSPPQILMEREMDRRKRAPQRFWTSYTDVHTSCSCTVVDKRL